MNVRHQVFVSSTYSDLQLERKYVVDELTKVGFIAIGMEQFPATDESQMDYICPLIDDSDYYVIILKGKYGSLALDGLSYTEKEFNYATQAAKPRVAFFYEEVEELKVADLDADLEKQRKLRDFKENLLKSRIVKYWKTKEDLASSVKDAVYDLVRRRPSPGWVRGDNIIDPKVFIELEQLRKEKAELVQNLGAARSNPSLPSDLMQGKDEVIVPFRLKDNYNIGFDDGRISRKSMTWDQVIEGIVDVLYEEPSEAKVYNILDNYLSQYIRVNQAQTPKLDYSFVKTCRFQFEALGLIVTFARRNDGLIAESIGPGVTESPLSVCWRFSELGKRYVSRLKAVPKTPTTTA